MPSTSNKYKTRSRKRADASSTKHQDEVSPASSSSSMPPKRKNPKPESKTGTIVSPASQCQDKEGAPDLPTYFFCNYCTFSADTKTSLDDHMHQHMLSCPLCPFNSVSRTKVAHHYKFEHGKDSEHSVFLYDKDPCLKCVFCTFMTYSTDYLEKHTITDHPGMTASSINCMIDKNVSAIVRKEDVQYYQNLLNKSLDKSGAKSNESSNIGIKSNPIIINDPQEKLEKAEHIFNFGNNNKSKHCLRARQNDKKLDSVRRQQNVYPDNLELHRMQAESRDHVTNYEADVFVIDSDSDSALDNSHNESMNTHNSTCIPHIIISNASPNIQTYSSRLQQPSQNTRAQKVLSSYPQNEQTHHLDSSVKSLSQQPTQQVFDESQLIYLKAMKNQQSTTSELQEAENKNLICGGQPLINNKTCHPVLNNVKSNSSLLMQNIKIQSYFLSGASKTDSGTGYHSERNSNCNVNLNCGMTGNHNVSSLSSFPDTTSDKIFLGQSKPDIVTTANLGQDIIVSCNQSFVGGASNIVLGQVYRQQQSTVSTADIRQQQYDILTTKYLGQQHRGIVLTQDVPFSHNQSSVGNFSNTHFSQTIDRQQLPGFVTTANKIQPNTVLSQNMPYSLYQASVGTISNTIQGQTVYNQPGFVTTSNLKQQLAGIVTTANMRQQQPNIVTAANWSQCVPCNISKTLQGQTVCNQQQPGFSKSNLGQQTCILTTANIRQQQPNIVTTANIRQQPNIVTTANIRQQQPNIVTTATMRQQQPNIVTTATMRQQPNIVTTANMRQQQPNIVTTATMRQQPNIVTTANMRQQQPNIVSTANMRPQQPNIVTTATMRQQPNIVTTANMRQQQPNIVTTATMRQQPNIVTTANMRQQQPNIVSTANMRPQKPNIVTTATMRQQQPNIVTTANMRQQQPNIVTTANMRQQQPNIVTTATMRQQQPNIVTTANMRQQQPNIVTTANMRQQPPNTDPNQNMPCRRYQPSVGTVSNTLEGQTVYIQQQSGSVTTQNLELHPGIVLTQGHTQSTIGNISNTHDSHTIYRQQQPNIVTAANMRQQQPNIVTTANMRQQQPNIVTTATMRQQQPNIVTAANWSLCVPFTNNQPSIYNTSNTHVSQTIYGQQPGFVTTANFKQQQAGIVTTANLRQQQPNVLSLNTPFSLYQPSVGAISKTLESHTMYSQQQPGLVRTVNSNQGNICSLTQASLTSIPNTQECHVFSQHHPNTFSSDTNFAKFESHPPESMRNSNSHLQPNQLGSKEQNQNLTFGNQNHSWVPISSVKEQTPLNVPTQMMTHQIPPAVPQRNSLDFQSICYEKSNLQSVSNSLIQGSENKFSYTAPTQHNHHTNVTENIVPDSTSHKSSSVQFLHHNLIPTEPSYARKVPYYSPNISPSPVVTEVTASPRHNLQNLTVQLVDLRSLPSGSFSTPRNVNFSAKTGHTYTSSMHLNNLALKNGPTRPLNTDVRPRGADLESIATHEKILISVTSPSKNNQIIYKDTPTSSIHQVFSKKEDRPGQEENKDCFIINKLKKMKTRARQKKIFSEKEDENKECCIRHSSRIRTPVIKDLQIDSDDNLQSDNDNDYSSDMGSDWNVNHKKEVFVHDSETLNFSCKGHFKCWICKKYYLKRSSVKMHIVIKHDAGLCAVDLVHSLKTKSVCLVLFCPRNCRYTTTQLQSITSHMKDCSKKPMHVQGKDILELNMNFLSTTYNKLLSMELTTLLTTTKVQQRNATKVKKHDSGQRLVKVSTKIGHSSVVPSIYAAQDTSSVTGTYQQNTCVLAVAHKPKQVTAKSHVSNRKYSILKTRPSCPREKSHRCGKNISQIVNSTLKSSSTITQSVFSFQKEPKSRLSPLLAIPGRQIVSRRVSTRASSLSQNSIITQYQRPCQPTENNDNTMNSISENDIICLD